MTDDEELNPKVSQEEWYHRVWDVALQKAYSEIEEFWKTGVLPYDSWPRQLLRECAATNSPELTGLVTSPDIACTYVLREIAYRWYTTNKE